MSHPPRRRRHSVSIHGLQNYKKLRQEEEFSFSTGEPRGAANPAAVLHNLISEGPALGFHVIATCDTYNNVNRFLGRKTLSEFEMRVLFQMSASDSASLIDTPNASTLGLHRALFTTTAKATSKPSAPTPCPATIGLKMLRSSSGGCSGSQIQTE